MNEDREKKRSILNLTHADHPDQRQKMEILLEKDACPFCAEQLEPWHDNPLELEGHYWVITKNDYPYAHTSLHYLFIHREHITRPEQISPAAMLEMLELMKTFSQTHHLPGGALVMRFGETNYTGASVDHLHLHLIAGGSQQEDRPPLWVPIGYETTTNSET